jgi:hypothetical protein
LDDKTPFKQLLGVSDVLTLRAQRLLLTNRPLIREFSLSQLSTTFPVNGTSMPPGDAYKRLVENQFRDWRLKVHGLVNRPIALTLAQLQALPSRTQITMHTCDEGWSAIGQWTGVPLARVLALAGPRLDARYVVFHCLDKINIDGNYYYESLDLFDALHPQTILAYGMNGKPLPIATVRRCDCAWSCRSDTRTLSTSIASRSSIDSTRLARGGAAGGRISTGQCGTRDNRRSWARDVRGRTSCLTNSASGTGPGPRAKPGNWASSIEARCPCSAVRSLRQDPVGQKHERNLGGHPGNCHFSDTSVE